LFGSGERITDPSCPTTLMVPQNGMSAVACGSAGPGGSHADRWTIAPSAWFAAFVRRIRKYDTPCWMTGPIRALLLLDRVS
jgi:hypothetical protein